MSTLSGVFNDSLTVPTTPSHLDIRSTSSRGLHVNLRSNAGAEMGTLSNPLQIAGSISVGAIADGAAFTAGTSSFNPSGGVFNDAVAALTTGTEGTARVTTNRALHVNVRDHLGNEATLTGNSLNVNLTNASVAVTGTFWQATQPISATSLPLPTGAALDTTLSTLSGKLPATLGQKLMASSMAVVIASDQSAVPVSGTFWQATQPVSIATMPSTPVTGTFWQATQPVSGTVTAAQATASSLNAQVVGSIASGSADSGNPVKVGGVYLSAPGTALTTGNRGDLLIDDQKQLIVSDAPHAWVVTQNTAIASSSAETTIVTAGAAGVFNDLQTLILTNATATACSATIKDATAGTTRMIIDLAANGGAVINLPVRHPQAAAAANWTCTLSSAAVTVHIYALCVQRK